MDLFTLVARLGLDSSEYEKGIGKARGSFGELGNFISAKAVAFGTMAAHAIERAADAAVNLGKSAIQAAADVEAEQAQFRATFGELQGSAEKAFDAISKSTGIMDTRLQNVGTKAFSQFKGAGIDAAEAISEMERYTTLAADAAAYYDITLEDADARLRSFLRGNTEAGDAIGLFTSESQRNTAAMDKYGKKWTALTEAQKQMLMLDISEEIYKQSGAIGQAARESDAWTNVVANMKEVWRQTLALFGEPIKAVIAPVIQDVQEWLNEENNKTLVTQFGLTVANAINWVLHPKLPTWEEVKEGSKDALNSIQTGFNTAINWTLGKLGLPDLETIQSDVQDWWSGQGDNAYERIKSVLSWTLGEFVTPNTEEATEKMGTWWEETGKPSFQSVVDWTLGELYLPAWIDLVTAVSDWWNNKISPKITALATIDIRNVDFPSLSDMVSAASAWWSSVKSTISEIFTINVKMHQGDTSYTPGKPDFGGGSGGGEGAGRGFATGLDYVPYNNFRARLHEGEAVLTKAEATAWRSGANTQQLDYVALGSAVGEAVREALDGVGVYMGAERVGDLVTERVSRNIAVRAQSRRYQPV